MHDWSFWALASLSVVLMGLGKGGFSGLGLVAMLVMGLVTSPITAAAIMLPILIVQDVVSILAYRRDFDWRILASMLPGAIAGIALGWALAARIDESAVRLAVGLIAVAFSLRAWLAAAPQAGRGAPGSPAGGLLWGGVAGFTSFISHAGGPPFQAHVLPMRLPPQVYAGTGTMFFATVNAVKVAPYLMLGQFSPDNLSTSAALAPLAIVSTMAGVWLVRRAPLGPFYHVVLGLTLLVGAKYCWDGARAALGL